MLLSADHKIRRWHPLAGRIVDEQFSFEPGHVRTQRMENGLPLLDAHNDWAMKALVGKIENMSVSPQTGITGKARFSKRAEVDPLVMDVEDGIADSVSLGTMVYAYQITEREGEVPLYLAVDHEPMEGSFVPVQADPGSRTQSHKVDGEPTILEEIPMSDKNTADLEKAAAEKAVETERTNIATLMQHGIDLGLGLDTVQSVIAEKLSLTDATSKMIAISARLRAKAAEDAKKDKKDEPLPQGQARTMAVDKDQSEKDAEGIIEYLAHKEMPSQNKLGENGKRFMGMTSVDVCRYVCDKHGVSTMGMPREDIIQRAMTPFRKNDIGAAHTTADLPNLLGDGLVNRALVKAYERTPDSYSSLVGETTFTDTRTKNFVQVGNLGPLRQVLQAAEYKRVSIGESKEKLNIDKYGEIFALTLEAILNDDLSAFVRMPAAFAQAAKLTEEAIVFGLLATGQVMLQDGVQCFHADHGNVGTGGDASAPDTTGLTDARTKMRKQKGITVAAGRLGIKPKYIVAPVKYELGLAQLMAPITPAETANVVPPYIRDMQYVISDVLDEANTQKWYGVADPAVMECIVISRLQGGRVFRVMQQEGWNVDGLEMKVRHWFGAGIVDYRGLYQNDGV